MKSLRRIFSRVCMFTLMLFVLAGCGSSKSPQSSGGANGTATNNESAGNANSNINAEEQQVVALQENPIVTMKIKDYGDITLELYPEMAPNTVNNFVTLANDGFYDGLIFHRVIANFMIQGGDPQGSGIGGPNYSIPGEFAANGFTQNTLSHTKGVLSMARTNNPNSAGSQFFIMSADGTYLDGQYAAFGKVIDGLDIVETLQSVPTNSSDKPAEDIVIESIQVDTNGEAVPAVIKAN